MKQFIKALDKQGNFGYFCNTFLLSDAKLKNIFLLGATFTSQCETMNASKKRNVDSI
jgi:hypothetical protein